MLGRLHEAGRRRRSWPRSAAGSSTPTRRCCRRSPGMHGPADALAYGVKVTGCTLFVVDAGVDTGPIVAQAAVPVDDDDTVETAARADQGRRARAAGRRGRPDGPRGLHDHRTERSGLRNRLTGSTTPGSRSAARWSPSTTRPASRTWSAACTPPASTLVSTGGSAALIEGLGLPVTQVEELTGFPECLDGRVKTLHPRVHAGILADRRLDSHVAAARRARRRAVRPRRLQPLPVQRRPSPPAPTPDECVEQIDIGGPSMVRAAAKNHPSVAIVTSPDAVRRRAGRGRRRRLHPRPSGSGWPPRRSCTPRRTTSPSRRWMGSVLTDTSEGERVPGVGRRHLGQGGGAAVRREPAPAGRALPQRLRRGGLARGRAAARQGDVLQQLRRRRRGPAGGVRLRRAGRGDHQARQPVRHRGRRATSPRRTARRTRATRCRRSAA